MHSRFRIPHSFRVRAKSKNLRRGDSAGGNRHARRGLLTKIGEEYLTDHFGLVSYFLSECWTQLHNQSRVSALQNKVFFGGALSGWDIYEVNKMASGLLKLLYSTISDKDLEWLLPSCWMKS